MGEDAFRQIVTTPMSGIYETVYLNQIQQMKDTSGNTASSQGQTSSVTSASGIASLQEAAGKLGRDSNKASYRAFKKVVELVIELIREFYDEPRCFRIVGEKGEVTYQNFDNSGLMPQPQGSVNGLDLGNRLPIMDIEVKPQKKSAYSKESQNQTALNLYGMGFFAPNNADASLACLDMMDFDGIEKVKENVSKNQTLLMQVMQLQQMVMQLGSIVDAEKGTNIVASMGGGQPTPESGGTQKKATESKGSLTTQAAAAARGSASPS